MNRSNHSTQSASVQVWDPLIRIFHWSLVGFFIIAYITEDDWEAVHNFAGYCIASLLLLRIFWGLVGTRYARFRSFVTRPATVIEYLKSLPGGKPKHYIGHNPAGGIMVLLLMLGLLFTLFTGMVTLAADGSGPLADTLFASWSEVLFEDVHEALANLMLLLIGVHVAGVIVSSLIHRENLIRSMINGRKSVQDEESP